jgi:hypothetical protein
MLKKIIVLFIFVGLSSIAAQSFRPIVSKSLVNSKAVIGDQNNLNILAVMVEFQPDDFDLTYGDGKFGSIYSQDYGNDIIDPLPHDLNYFENHLDFAVNYYSKVSKGQVNIQYNVLPDILTVSKPMRDYSPLAGDTFKILADFSQEVWGLVDVANPNFDFSEYNVFVIFHAGVGKDISTSDLFGEARDLPSIYMGLNSFKEFYGESFSGFPLSGGTFVTNTMILPETESREESGFGGVVLLELSINGLIVSSLASHLGLPDLFDAETGKSAIGRFGLMDGQSLFAFAGLFPPEPSAWEKIFLGWEEPTIVKANSTNVLVSTNQIAQDLDAKIVKVPINSTEYYLIENRSRDANKDGVEVTYKVGGQVRTIIFDEDLDNFNNAFIDTLKGVVLDVDEFDWAVPGSGLLIWHIDEKIIDEGLATNRVNVGKSRGVDLEEADGIQDIGEEFQTIFGDIIIAEGDEFDFWYSSNTSKLFDNEFGIDTKPNTLTNSGANSLITFSNFSDIGNQMSFDVAFGTEKISLLNSIEVDSNLVVSNYKTLANENASYFLSDDNLLKVGNQIDQLNDFSTNNYVVVEAVNEQIIIGGNSNQLNISNYSNNTFTNLSLETSSVISSPIVIQNNIENTMDIYVGLTNGAIEKYNYNFVTKELPNLETTLNLLDNPIKQIAIMDNEIVAVTDNNFNNSDNNNLTFFSNIKKVILTKNRSGNYISIIQTEDNSIFTFSKGHDEAKLIYVGDSHIESIALGDLKNDGENYIVFNQENKIHAINMSGSVAEDFPFELNDTNSFMGVPLTADIDGDGQSEILSTSIDGNIYAVSGINGKVISGFPLSTGGSFSGLQTIVKRVNDLLLSVVTDQNEFYFWSINSTGDVEWGSEFGNNFNSSSMHIAKSKNYISEYFPKNRTYNWPNPAYGNETFIRTYVAEDSHVRVKVFDLSGDLVDELDFFATGGVDNESAWDVSQIQSGAYFAHVEVKSNSGKTESKIIKIAVVK